MDIGGYKRTLLFTILSDKFTKIQLFSQFQVKVLILHGCSAQTIILKNKKLIDELNKELSKVRYRSLNIFASLMLLYKSIKWT